MAVADICLIMTAIISLHGTFTIADRISRLEMGYLEDINATSHTQAEVNKLIAANKRMEAAINDVHQMENNQLAAAAEVLKAFKTYAGDVRDLNLLQPPPAIPTSQIAIHTASAWLARFGLLACGLYLIQLLVSKFRFDTRLAAQHDAMADALSLIPDDQKLELNTLLPALTPKLDFGPMPKVMTEQILEAGTRGAETVNKR